MSDSDDLFNCGVSEGYKGGIHLAMFGLFSICAAYNLGCAFTRSSSKSRNQFAYYTIAAMYEATQVRAHWDCKP